MHPRPLILGLLGLAALTACQEEPPPARACQENQDCSRQICQDGRCATLSCATAGDCPSGTCDLERCVPVACLRDPDCGGGGLVCVLGVCRPPDGGYIPPPPRRDGGFELGPGDPEPGQDARRPDVRPADAAPLDLGPDPRPDRGPPGDPVLGRYTLELSFIESDCPARIDGAADGLLVLELSARDPLRGQIEGIVRDPVAVEGSLDSVNLSLSTPSPARIDILCDIDIALTLTGSTTPGGLVGDLHWTLSERAPCELIDLAGGCTRRDGFIGRRTSP